MADGGGRDVAGPVALLVVLDGLGDLPHPALGGTSPVEAAPTPSLDSLVGRGESGELSVAGPGVAPESDAGVFALLGYDPVTDSPGRGVLEALGSGIDLRAGDVALRLNFATCDGEGRVVDARVGRSLGTAESAELARTLSEAGLLDDVGIDVLVRSTVGHRGVVRLRPRIGEGLSPNVSNADPFYEKVGGMGRAVQPASPRVEAVRALDDSPAAARTADALNRLLERASPLLAGHSVNARRALAGKKVGNALLLRNAGALDPRRPEPFRARWGVAGGAVTEMPVERGIAQVLGLEDRYLGPMTGDRDVGYRARAAAVLELASRVPFLYVHLKGPDEPAHDGDPVRKRDVIAAIDRSFFGPLLEQLDLERVRLAVTGDHATPCVLGRHSDDPVPWLLAGPGFSGSSPAKFGSRAALSASARISRASQIVPALLSRQGPAGSA